MMTLDDTNKQVKGLEVKRLEVDRLGVIVRTNKVHLFLPRSHHQKRKALVEPISAEETKMEKMMIEVIDRDDEQLICLDPQIIARPKVIIEEALDQPNYSVLLVERIRVLFFSLKETQKSIIGLQPRNWKTLII